MIEAIDKKYLTGLKFTDRKEKKIEKDGRKVTTYEAVTRPLKPEDVLSWADKGDVIVLVTADGKKVTVDKDQGAK